MKLELDLQRRKPKSGKIVVEKKPFDTAGLGIVIVDLWNWHWCKTASERVGAFVPRLNKVLECARSLGIQVIHCPTDGAISYVGTPPRERALAIPKHPQPERKRHNWPPGRSAGCMCGPGSECRMNFGWNAMCPKLVVSDDDFIAVETDEVYSICKELGLVNLIYMGVHTNCCVLARPEGMGVMMGLGLNCMLARDVTDGLTEYDPARGYTPDDGTAEVVRHFERYICPTINMAEECRRAGLWHDDWIVEPVRVTPWGVKDRPHIFAKPVTVSLTIPWLEGAEVRYTLDGSEPTPESKLYSRPFLLKDTAVVRSAAYRNGERVSFEGSAYFYKLPPKPPMPEVHLSDLEPIETSFHPYNVNAPKTDRSVRRTQLKMRGVKYERGMGVLAPAQLVYELDAKYDRFVARAGVDEAMMCDCYGWGNAIYPAIIFRVFIDGKLAAESPVQRINEEPWRFDVAIPRGSRIISLAAVSAGDTFGFDHADWANAGFVLGKR